MILTDGWDSIGFANAKNIALIQTFGNKQGRALSWVIVRCSPEELQGAIQLEASGCGPRDCGPNTRQLLRLGRLLRCVGDSIGVSVGNGGGGDRGLLPGCTYVLLESIHIRSWFGLYSRGYVVGRGARRAGGDGEDGDARAAGRLARARARCAARASARAHFLEQGRTRGGSRRPLNRSTTIPHRAPVCLSQIRERLARPHILGPSRARHASVSVL